MNYQKVCYTSPVLHAVDVLVIALLLTAVVVRFRHQGFLVHGSYWLMAWVQESGRGFDNVILAGLIHIVALSACFVYARATRRFRAPSGRPLDACVARDGEGAQTPFALFAA